DQGDVVDFLTTQLLVVGGLIPVSAAVQAVDALAGRGEVGEEEEVGIACDVRVLCEELRELRVRAGDVVLVGEEGRVGFEDLSERGAHAKESEELLANGGEVFSGWGGGSGRGGCGCGFCLGVGAWRGGKEKRCVCEGCG